MKLPRKVTKFSMELRHLQKLYEIENITGNRADPEKVAVLKEHGNKVFKPEEWISPQQIASFFCRCLYQKSTTEKPIKVRYFF